MKIIIALLVAGALVLGWMYIAPSGASPDAHLEQALFNATINLEEFGSGEVTFLDGEAALSAGGGESPAGLASLKGPRTAIWNNERADIFALLSVSGGGSGVFQYLTQFEYADGKAKEVGRVLLGDRIVVDAIAAEVVAPDEFEVLVSIRDRKVFDAMAAAPVEARVLHFSTKNGLALSDVVFGAVAQPDIVLVWPLPSEEVTAAFVVQGAARGPWFFEASFPIEIRSGNGSVVATAIAQAQGEWMTEELVPFTAPVSLPSGAKGVYALVLKKDNPSGLPEHDQSYEIPIVIQ